MTQPIAKIRLAQGNVGFYDSLTGIRLTKAAPEGIIYSGKNTVNIKKAIKEGKVVLKEGSLSSFQNEPVLKREIEIDKPKTVKAIKNIKKETKIVEKIEPIKSVSKKQEIIENQNQIKKLSVGNTVKNKKEDKPDTNNVPENKKEDKKE